jgi:hypothetical protein
MKIIKSILFYIGFYNYIIKIILRCIKFYLKNFNSGQGVFFFKKKKQESFGILVAKTSILMDKNNTCFLVMDQALPNSF